MSRGKRRETDYGWFDVAARHISTQIDLTRGMVALQEICAAWASQYLPDGLVYIRLGTAESELIIVQPRNEPGRYASSGMLARFLYLMMGHKVMRTVANDNRRPTPSAGLFLVYDGTVEQNRILAHRLLSKDKGCDKEKP